MGHRLEADATWKRSFRDKCVPKYNLGTRGIVGRLCETAAI